MAEGMNIGEFNAKVRGWGLADKKKLKNKLAQLGVKGTSKLMKIGTRFGKDQGQINRVAFQFPRYGVFLEKGVGRGHPIQSVKETAAVMGGKGRKPKPWFNPVIKEELPELGSIAADYFVQSYINASRILIQ